MTPTAPLTVCVFAGSAPASDPTHRIVAARLGELLAAAGVGIVYGGGRLGMMGAFADAASAAGPKMLARPMHSDTTPVKILMTQISLSAMLLQVA